MKRSLALRIAALTAGAYLAACGILTPLAPTLAPVPTLVLVEHNMKLVMGVSDRVLV